VVSTRNRRSSAERLLGLLAKQTLAPAEYEVILVVDGSTDDTTAVARGWQAPFQLTVLEQPFAGTATARNTGAAAARGSIVAFLADDLTPGARLLEAHVGAHAAEGDALVVGGYPPTRGPGSGYLEMADRAWWHDRFAAMQEPAHRFTYRDVLGGNLSLRLALFRALGGFDPEFVETHEDHALGVRALKVGAAIRFIPDVAERVRSGWSLADAFRHARARGRADVLLGRRDPGLRPSMPLAALAAPRTVAGRLGHRIAFSWPRLGDLGLATIAGLLRLMERVQLRSRWQRLFVAAERHSYLRGVADLVGDRRALARFVDDGALAARNVEPRVLEIDLADLGRAMGEIDRVRPTAVRVFLRGTPVGVVASPPGTEPLRPVHVRAAVASELEWPMFLALTAASVDGELSVSVADR
jgi:hypothetical protein